MARRDKLTKDPSFTLKEEGSASSSKKPWIDYELDTIDEDRTSTEGSEFSDVQERTFRFGLSSSNSEEEEEEGHVIHLSKPSIRQQSNQYHSLSPTGDANSPTSTTPFQSPEVPQTALTFDANDDGGHIKQQTILESFKASKAKIRKRVLKSIRNDIVKMVETKDSGHGSVVMRRGKVAFQGDLSERLTKASVVGTKMVPKIVFPAAPKLFRDAWVFVELLLTIVQFVYAFFSTEWRINRLYNALYIALSSVNLVLALIDAFYYFYELGSCMVLYQRCRKRRMKKKRQSHGDYEEVDSGHLISNDDSDSDIDDEEMHAITAKQSTCCKRFRISPDTKEKLNTWFELIRNILSELLIYPLVVMDLFGLISDPDIEDKLNFSFFLIGSFYLVLSVYIARVVISVLTLLTMKNLLSATESGKKNIVFIVRFLFHSIGQVIVHLCCVIAVGLKIKQENDHNNGHFHASPILWIVIVGGWFIPFIGVITYFLVNYFWAQQFSVGFFIELVSLLQEGDVVGSLMHSKSEMEHEAEERAEKILEKMEYKKIKKEYKERDSVGNLMRVYYPIKLPLFITLCIVYNIALGGFFAALLHTSKQGNIVLIDLNDTIGICLLVIIAIITLANIHLIIVSNTTLFLFVGALAVFFLLPGMIAAPLLLLIIVTYRKIHHKGTETPLSERENSE